VLGGIYTPRRVLRGRVTTSDDFRPEGCYSGGHFRNFDPSPPRPPNWGYENSDIRRSRRGLWACGVWRRYLSSRCGVTDLRKSGSGLRLYMRSFVAVSTISGVGYKLLHILATMRYSFYFAIRIFELSIRILFEYSNFSLTDDWCHVAWHSMPRGNQRRRSRSATLPYIFHHVRRSVQTTRWLLIVSPCSLTAFV
jgi:hypothetical protein